MVTFSPLRGIEPLTTRGCSESLLEQLRSRLWRSLEGSNEEDTGIYESIYDLPAGPVLDIKVDERRKEFSNDIFILDLSSI